MELFGPGMCYPWGKFHSFIHSLTYSFSHSSTYLLELISFYRPVQCNIVLFIIVVITLRTTLRSMNGVNTQIKHFRYRLYDHDAFDKVVVLMLSVLTHKTLLFCCPKGGDAEDTGPVLYHRRTLGSWVLRTRQHVP